MLLDGDGFIFKDGFLQQGEQGGRNAANQLLTALQEYVDGNFPGIASPKIMTKIYINMKGLSELCARGGIITEQSLLDDFVRGFNGAVPLFDLVDIGAGKDKPYDKIGGMQCNIWSPCARIASVVEWSLSFELAKPARSRSFSPYANLLALQRSSNYIYTIATATKYFWDVRSIVDILGFCKIY